MGKIIDSSGSLYIKNSIFYVKNSNMEQSVSAKIIQLSTNHCCHLEQDISSNLIQTSLSCLHNQKGSG